MNKDDRRVAASLARTILWKKNVTEDEIIFAMGQLPSTGYRALGLRTKLKERLNLVQAGGDWRKPWE
jgi:hypothetical protein